MFPAVSHDHAYAAATVNYRFGIHRRLSFRSTAPRIPLSSLETKPARRLYSKSLLGAELSSTPPGFTTTVRAPLSSDPSSRLTENYTQRVTGKIRSLSNRTGSWANGTRTLLSRFLGAQGPALVAGKPPLRFQGPNAGVAYRPDARFFEATGLAILTILIQHYKVEPHPKFAGESFRRLKERYSQASMRITLT